MRSRQKKYFQNLTLVSLFGSLLFMTGCDDDEVDIQFQCAMDFLTTWSISADCLESLPPPIPLVNNQDQSRFDHWSYQAEGNDGKIEGVWLVIEKPPGYHRPNDDNYPHYTHERIRYNCEVQMENAETGEYQSDCPVFSGRTEPLYFDDESGELSTARHDVEFLEPDPASQEALDEMCDEVPDDLPCEYYSQIRTHSSYINAQVFDEGRIEGIVQHRYTREILNGDGYPQIDRSHGHPTYFHMVRIADSYQPLGEITAHSLVLLEEPPHAFPGALESLDIFISDPAQPVIESYSVDRFYEYSGYLYEWALRLYDGEIQVLDAEGKHAHNLIEHHYDGEPLIYTGAAARVGLGSDDPERQSASVNRYAFYFQWLVNNANETRTEFFYHSESADVTTWEDILHVHINLSLVPD